MTQSKLCIKFVFSVQESDKNVFLLLGLNGRVLSMKMCNSLLVFK